MFLKFGPMAFGTFVFFTLIFGAVGGVAPMFVPVKEELRGIAKIMLITTAVCCYIMWLTTFLSQLNPLFGPMVSNVTLSLIKKGWK